MSGAIVWLTGMSGSGKSALAQGLATILGRHGRVEVLDGDEMRRQMSPGLGFSKDDRDINVRRIAFIARLLAKHGVTVIVATISPYAETRTEARQLAEAQGLPFVEVFAHADLAWLVQRDPKGLYRRALSGEMAQFTGISDPYEAPTDPDVTVHTHRDPYESNLQTIAAALVARGLLPQP